MRWSGGRGGLRSRQSLHPNPAPSPNRHELPTSPDLPPSPQRHGLPSSPGPVAVPKKAGHGLPTATVPPQKGLPRTPAIPWTCHHPQKWPAADSHRLPGTAVPPRKGLPRTPDSHRPTQKRPATDSHRPRSQRPTHKRLPRIPGSGFRAEFWNPGIPGIPGCSSSGLTKNLEGLKSVPWSTPGEVAQERFGSLRFPNSGMSRAKCTWARQDSSQMHVGAPGLEPNAYFWTKTRARRLFFGQNSSQTLISGPKLERDAHPRAVTRAG